MSTETKPETTPEPGKAPAAESPATTRSFGADWIPSIKTTIAAIILALLIGAVLIAFSSQAVIETLPYFFSYPWDFFSEAGHAIGESYWALITGSVGSTSALATTLVRSAPLICAGLGVTLAFRAGLFNIGAQGQLILGALAAGYVGFTWDLPPGIHLLAALVAGLLGGALWGGIAGVLKARTGAHEVITTIMLNYVAIQVVLFGLRSDFLRQEGSSQPISKVLTPIARVPGILDPFGIPSIRLHYGFVLALVMAVVVSWFLFKTTKGFELRAAGFNLTAARYAGMSASGSIILAMTLSGALAALGGSMEVLGTVPQMSNDISSGFGFNAIALALLAGNRPFGIVLAALLFGALRTGGGLMQVQTGIPLDLLFFIQALVIMFVAAPGLVRSIWRLRAPRTPTGTAVDGARA